MKHILICGETSFIGRAVAARLAAFPEMYACESISLRGDAWKQHDFSRCDAVVHVAGIAHVSSKNVSDAAYHEINCQLALECARHAKAAGVKQFIFLSSMIVYGPAARAGRNWVIDAHTPPAPANAYGQSKLDAEAGLSAMSDASFRVAILRPPMVYGPGCRGNYTLLQKWVGKIPFFPDFPGRRSVIYVENLAEFIRHIIERNDCGVFHPQDASVATTAHIARAIAQARGERLYLTKLFNPFIRILGGVGFVRRAFGDMQYDPALSAYPENYRIYSLSQAIQKTEAKGDA